MTTPIDERLRAAATRIVRKFKSAPGTVGTEPARFRFRTPGVYDVTTMADTGEVIELIDLHVSPMVEVNERDLRNTAVRVGDAKIYVAVDLLPATVPVERIKTGVDVIYRPDTPARDVTYTVISVVPYDSGDDTAALALILRQKGSE